MPRTVALMSAERVTVSFDPAVAQRVRQCGARRPGETSAIPRQARPRRRMREAGEQIALWYAAHPTYVKDALAEAAAALDRPTE